MSLLKGLLRSLTPHDSSSGLSNTLFRQFAPGAVQIRTAVKKAGQSVRNTGGTAGKRLGLRKSGGQFVNRGELLVKQRGTRYHPGQHVGIGRDHTLFALEPGYLRFYRVKRERPHFSRNPYKTMCAIALKEDDPVPRPENEMGRSRRFNLVELNEFYKTYQLGQGTPPKEYKPPKNPYKLPKQSKLPSPFEQKQ